MRGEMADFHDWQSLNREELREMYAAQPMSAIAARYGVTIGAVAHKLKAWGIKGAHAPGPKPSFNPDPKELADLYSRMSMREIAVHFGVGETVVFHRIKQAGLTPVSRSERLKGRLKSDSHRANLSAALVGNLVGERNPNWKGGVSGEARRGRNTALHRTWKQAVLEAAAYHCQRCGVEQGSRCDCCGHIRRLHVHHIKTYAKHPELRYSPDNGEALCEKCHFAEHYVKTG